MAEEEKVMTDAEATKAVIDSLNGEKETVASPAAGAEDVGVSTSTTDEVNNDETPAGDDEKVIQARDGIHTIPYSELDDARTKAQDAIAEAEAAAEKLEDLATKNAELQGKLSEFETAQVKDEKAGDTTQTDSFMTDLQIEFPALATGLQTFLDAKETAHKTELEAVRQELEPLKKGLEDSQQFKEETRVEAHFSAIEKAFKNFEDIIESVEFDKWRAALPQYVQANVNDILDKGTSIQVIDVLSDFDKSTSSTKDLNRKVTEAETAAKQQNPATMSDIPGSSTMAVDDDEAILSMSHSQLFSKYMNMDPKKAMETVTRLI